MNLEQRWGQEKDHHGCYMQCSRERDKDGDSMSSKEAVATIWGEKVDWAGWQQCTWSW